MATQAETPLSLFQEMKSDCLRKGLSPPRGGCQWLHRSELHFQLHHCSGCCTFSVSLEAASSYTELPVWATHVLSQAPMVIFVSALHVKLYRFYRFSAATPLSPQMILILICGCSKMGGFQECVYHITAEALIFRPRNV